MKKTEENKSVTLNYFYKKKVIVFQRKKGYRFSVDAPILADFLPFSQKEALEIGTGCGIISLLAVYKNKFSFLHGLEIQNNLAQLAEINVKKNNFSKKMNIFHADFRKIYKNFNGIKTIFSNPPFIGINEGRLSPNKEIRNAKTEINLTLKDLLKKSYSILGKKGNLYLILPYSRFNELKKLTKNIGLFFSKIRLVFSFKHGKPERFLIQLTNYDVSMKKMRPLVIFKEKGVYTKEVEKILTG